MGLFKLLQKWFTRIAGIFDRGVIQLVVLEID